MLLKGEQGSHLLAYHTPNLEGAPLAILIHGWEGNTESGYILSAAHHLYGQGYQILRLALRDHDHSHHLNRELFHSCRLDEVVNATSDAISRIQAAKNYLIGFSLGGNFAIRISNALSNQEQRPDRTVAVCPLLIAADTMSKLEHGSPIYHFYFHRKWQKSLRKKQQLFPDDFQHVDLKQLKSLRALTDYFVTQHTEFPDSESYFEGYSIRAEKLSNLTTPVDILMSKDDPVIEPEFFQSLETHPVISVTYTDYGGHCGFIANRRFDCWADSFISNALKK